MSEQTTDQQQTSIKTPGPYPEGGADIWQEFLNKYFGTPHISEEDWNAAESKPYGSASYSDYLETPEYRGLESLLQGNNQYQQTQFNGLMNDVVNPAYDQFGQGLDYIAGSGGRYDENMQAPIHGVSAAQEAANANPLTISFGGQDFNLAQQGGINQAKTKYDMLKNVQDNRLAFNSSVLPNLNAQRLTGQITPGQMEYDFDIAHNPAAIEADYIQNSLAPFGMNMQTLRYGVPTQSMSGQSSGSSEYGLLGNLGQFQQLFSNAGISAKDVWDFAKSAGGSLLDGYNSLSDWGSQNTATQENPYGNSDDSWFSW